MKGVIFYDSIYRANVSINIRSGDDCTRNYGWGFNRNRCVWRCDYLRTDNHLDHQTYRN